MSKYIANTTIGYTSQDSIASGKTFDPSEIGISPDDIKGLLKRGDITLVSEESKPSTNPGTSRPNVVDTLVLIAAAQTIEELDLLAAGEERKTVLPAIENRRLELAE